MYPARFAHHRLDAFAVILEALRLGDAIARELPRGYGKLSDQLSRALLGAYLQFSEGWRLRARGRAGGPGLAADTLPRSQP